MDLFLNLSCFFPFYPRRLENVPWISQ